MSKVLFINGNLHGHINPTLPIVKELTSRGEEVYYFSTKEFREKIEAAGAVFMDYGDEFEQFLHDFHTHGTHPFYTLMEYMLFFDRTIIPIVLKKTEGMLFHYMIHDVMFGGGNFLGKIMKLPTIGSCSSFVIETPPLPDHMLKPGFHPQLDYIYEQLKEVEKEWNWKELSISDIFFQKAPMTLVYTSRFFHPQSDTLDDTYRFVGPSIIDRNETIDFPLTKVPNKKLIYISFGTINNNQNDFYRLCFEAFRETEFQIVLSVGNKTDIRCLDPIPDNFIVKNYVPQLELLKIADLFISHGGLNSVSEALYYGTPVIAIPIANDQPAVAKRLSDLGAGLQLKMEDITPSSLRDSVSQILSEQGFQSSSKKIGESFMEAGGYKKSVNEVISYMNSMKTYIGI